MEQKTIQQYRQHLFEKKELLDNAIAKLKEEFIGIDSVIDQMADAVGSWVFFPEMQEKPVIINLWGLTGIGKTSLVKRFAELIGFNERYYRFDLGESTGKYFDIQDSFRDIYENCDKEAFIIGLDEFQLARTINEKQEEMDKASSRAIWDLLDSGKFDILDFNYNMGTFNKLIKKLDIALAKGVEVEKGLVIENEEFFKTLLEIQDQEDEEDDDIENTAEKKTDKIKKIYFVPEVNLTTLYYVVSDQYISKGELRDKLNEMDGEETIEFLISLYKKALKPKTVDCSKALVFIMGNLDEVYSMTHDFNPDMSADEFHKQSLKITVTQVKNALQTRFRSEQIARLGNNHIIYPTFDRKAFQGIIRLELGKIHKKVAKVYNIDMVFDDKIEQLIYDEGVYPTQGTRPLFTTIHQVIDARLGKILNEVYLNGFLVDTLRFTVEKNAEKAKEAISIILVDFIKNGEVIHQLRENQQLVLGKLRSEKLNDEQAITAVHESGHVILSSILMRTIPESVFSVTADSNSLGFVLARPQWNYVSKKEVVNRLAVLLGGLTAEKVIFGDENITIGSNSDLQNATRLATHVLYACGMGNTPAHFGNEHLEDTPSVIFDDDRGGINEEAKLLLKKAEDLAMDTLIEQKMLLVRLADYLSDKRAANKDKIREFIDKYAINFNISDIIEDADHLFYRNHLKELVKNYKS